MSEVFREFDIPVLGSKLYCPQLKRPQEVDYLSVNKRVAYVLRYLRDNGPSSSFAITKHEHHTSHQLGEVVTRLRNGGFLDDIGRVKGEGIIRKINFYGWDLLDQIEAELDAGGQAPNEHPPHVE